MRIYISSPTLQVGEMSFYKKSIWCTIKKKGKIQSVNMYHKRYFKTETKDDMDDKYEPCISSLRYLFVLHLHIDK